MTDKISTWYVVSDAPNRIEPVDEDTPTHYQTPEEAGDGIVNGFHGEAGTRYVLKVEVVPVAIYDRAWSLARSQPDGPADTFADGRTGAGTEVG